MPLAFADRIENAARRITRRRRTTAACWAAAAVLAVGLVLSSLDYLLGVDHVGARMLITGALLAAVVAIAWRAAQAHRQRTSPLTVAQELERRHPAHRNLLASGWEFSRQGTDDPTAGSEDLRRAVVLRAALAAESLDFTALAPRAPLRRAVLAAALASAALATPAAIAPQSFGTGLARLVNPFSAADWPRRHDLAFDDVPSHTPVGDDFAVALRDRRGRLPASIEVQYRTGEHGGWRRHTQVYAGGGDAVEIRLPNVQASFDFRAVGGDHRSMPWQRVTAAPAPQITSLRATVEPPAYSGLPTADASEPVHIVATSAVALHGTTNVPVMAACLEAAGQEPLVLQVGDDGRSFRSPPTPWRPAASAAWTFTFTTPAGMAATAARGLNIEVAPDRPPSVQFLEPLDELAVRTVATIALAVEARDDLAVRSITLAIDRDATPAVEVDPAPPTRQVELFRADAPAPGVKTISHSVDLAALDPAVNSRWQLQAVAEDFAGQQSAASRPVRLRIISDSDFVRRLDALESRLTLAIERARSRQQQARDSLQSWIDSNVRPGGDATAVALARQRAAVAAISGGHDSARRLAGLILTEIRRNAWPDDRAQATAQRAADALDRLADTQLPRIEHSLAALSRDWRRSEAPASAPLSAAESEALVAVAADGSQVVATLTRLLENAVQADAVRQLQRDLAALQERQAKELAATKALAAQQFAGDAEEDDAAHDFADAAIRQRDLAAALAGLLPRMRQAAIALAGSNPPDAARLDAAAAFADDQRLQSVAQSAADHLTARRSSQAAADQWQLLDRLDQLQRLLAGDAGDGGAQLPAQADGQTGAESAQDPSLPTSGPRGASPGDDAATAGAEATPIDRAALDTLVNDLWGQLPARQREQLLQPLGEEFLPAYAADVEAYFRALAEPREETVP